MEENNNNQQPSQFGNQTGSQFAGQPNQFNGQPNQFNGQVNQFNGQPNQFNGQLNQFQNQTGSRFASQPNQFNGQPNQFQNQTGFQYQNQNVNQTGFQPGSMYANNAMVNAQKPKKKVWPIVIGVAALLLVVISIAVAALVIPNNKKINSSAKKITGNAQIDNGLDQLISESSLSENSVYNQIEFDKLFEKAKDNTLNVSGNFNVSIAGSEPVNAGIVFDGVNDLNNNVLQYDLSVNAFGADLASGIVTFTKESLFVNSELLGSDTYRVDFENFVERFDASQWSRLLNLKLQDKLESEEFDAAMEDIVSQENYSEEMKKIYEESFADLEVKYEKADKMTVNIDGKDVSCNGVNMILDMDDLNAALADWSDKLVESEYYNKIKEENNLEATEINIQAKSDIVISWYFDKKGRIVRVITPEDIILNDGEDDLCIDLEVGFDGVDIITDKMYINIGMSVDEDKVYIDAYKDVERMDDTKYEYITFEVSNDKEKVTMAYDNKTVEEDGSFAMNLSVIDDAQEVMKVNANGSVTDIEKGNTFTFSLDECNVAVEGETLASFDGKISVSSDKKDVSVPENSLDMLEMSESDIYGMIMGIMYK
ncbi:MAG: hypothetical protein IIW54_07230 [Lachnospiraceae bacterium]|nr:hypothetical protein [Lachnospiraceae bacterium]